MSLIAKIGCIVFIFYVLWFRYAFREMHVILYGSVGIAAFCMLFDMWSSHINLLDFCPIGVLMNLVMCVYSIITGLWVAVSQDTLISLVKTYAAFSMVCIVVCYVSKIENGIGWLVNVLILVNVLSALFIIFRGYEYPGYGYVLGPSQNPNQLGTALLSGLFCVAYKSHQVDKKLPLHFVSALLILYAIISCGSRKSLIAAGIVVALWMYPLCSDLWKSGSNERRVFLVAVVVLALGGIYYYFVTYFQNTDIYQRMMLLGDSNEFSSRHRKLYYVYALDYFSEHPIFGIGLGQFLYWNPYNQMSHSTYAEAISCWGTVGCLLYFIPAIHAGFKTVYLAFTSEKTYIPRIVLVLLVTEAFVGLGQVWFYEIEHLLIWTLIFYILDDLTAEQEAKELKPVYRYLRS